MNECMHACMCVYKKKDLKRVHVISGSLDEADMKKSVSIKTKESAFSSAIFNFLIPRGVLKHLCSRSARFRVCRKVLPISYICYSML